MSVRFSSKFPKHLVVSRSASEGCLGAQQLLNLRMKMAMREFDKLGDREAHFRRGFEPPSHCFADCVKFYERYLYVYRRAECTCKTCSSASFSMPDPTSESHYNSQRLRLCNFWSSGVANSDSFVSLTPCPGPFQLLRCFANSLLLFPPSRPSKSSANSLFYSSPSQVLGHEQRLSLTSAESDPTLCVPPI